MDLQKMLDERVKFWDDEAKKLTNLIQSMTIQDEKEIKRLKEDFLLRMNDDFNKYKGIVQLRNPIVYVKCNDDTNEIKVEKYM